MGCGIDLIILSFTLSGGGYQRLRAHLYGSLLYYLQIAQKPEEPDTLQTGTLFYHNPMYEY